MDRIVDSRKLTSDTYKTIDAIKNSVYHTEAERQHAIYTTPETEPGSILHASSHHAKACQPAHSGGLKLQEAVSTHLPQAGIPGVVGETLTHIAVHAFGDHREPPLGEENGRLHFLCALDKSHKHCHAQ